MARPTTPTNPTQALPFHLSLAMLHGISSSAALPFVKNALPCLNPNVRGPMRDLLEKMPKLPGGAIHPAMSAAVQNEALKSLSDLLTGIHRYQHYPYHRNVAEPPVVWRKGTAKLLDYGFTEADDKPVIFFIPSLINRYYILDLMPEHSLVHFLRRKGYHCYVMDWDAPGPQEKRFKCNEYVGDYLTETLSLIADRTQKKIVLAGYCMGGLLSLALAQLMPDDLAGLVLIATPWDFGSDDFATTRLDPPSLKQMESLLHQHDPVPADVIHALFYCANPWIFDHKFRQFAHMPDGEDVRDFVALEQWVNDGVPLALPLARECLVDWAQHNVTGNQQWRVQHEVIDPSQLRIPAFIVAPQHDAIVPTGCALPLAGMIRKSTLHEPISGHVSMVVGPRAMHDLWNPMAKWLEGVSGM